MGLKKQARVPAAGRGVLSLALVCAMSHAAAAQPSNPRAADAQALFEQGLAAAEAHDCPRAIPLFRKSQETYPARGTLYNLALCEREIGQVASAWRHLKELLPQLEPGDPRLPTAKQELTSLEPRLPRLVLELAQGAPAPAELLLDRAPLPQASVGSELPVDPGDHVLVVRWADGRQTETRVSLPESARKDVRIEPPPAAAAPPPASVPPAAQAPSPPPDAPSTPPSSGRRTLAFAIGGVGAAALGVSLVTGGLALGTKGDLEEECPTPSRCSDDGMSLSSRGQTLTTTSTVLGAVGLVGLGAGVVLLLTAPAQGTSVALTPAILPGGGGALLRSRF
ncbi:preprotein translocase subunit TatA [Sorangium sp. So ce321]|uniref:tetratricopeptide repeat protein n=1 Tax=Sorangium sp. So ce321 TaxID=3133300 RepID=UPI003F5FE057